MSADARLPRLQKHVRCALYCGAVAGVGLDWRTGRIRGLRLRTADAHAEACELCSTRCPKVRRQIFFRPHQSPNGQASAASPRVTRASPSRRAAASAGTQCSALRRRCAPRAWERPPRPVSSQGGRPPARRPKGGSSAQGLRPHDPGAAPPQAAWTAAPWAPCWLLRRREGWHGRDRPIPVAPGSRRAVRVVQAGCFAAWMQAPTGAEPQPPPASTSSYGLGGLDLSMIRRNHARPYASIFSHCPAVSRIERCTSFSSAGVGGRPRGRLGCSISQLYLIDVTHLILFM